MQPPNSDHTSLGIYPVSFMILELPESKNGIAREIDSKWCSSFTCCVRHNVLVLIQGFVQQTQVRIGPTVFELSVRNTHGIRSLLSADMRCHPESLELDLF